MSKYISPENRAKIISAIKDEGMSIEDASRTYTITESTIRKWLRHQTKNAHTSSTDHQCVEWLVRNNMSPSMSSKGKPWNNGKQESFYFTFKTECGAPQRLPTIEALIEVIGRYIHYYNTRRIHSALKMPPRVFYEKHKRKPVS